MSYIDCDHCGTPLPTDKALDKDGLAFCGSSCLEGYKTKHPNFIPKEEIEEEELEA